MIEETIEKVSLVIVLIFTLAGLCCLRLGWQRRGRKGRARGSRTLFRKETGKGKTLDFTPFTLFTTQEDYTLLKEHTERAVKQRKAPESEVKWTPELREASRRHLHDLGKSGVRVVTIERKKEEGL